MPVVPPVVPHWDLRTRWWGEPWPSREQRSPVCSQDELRIPTPVGEQCVFCREDVEADDQGMSFPAYRHAATGTTMLDPAHAHSECMLRTVMGCAGHLTGAGHTCTEQGSGLAYRAEGRRVQDWLATALAEGRASPSKPGYSEVFSAWEGGR